MVQNSVAIQKIWNSKLGRHGSLPPAELQVCRITSLPLEWSPSWGDPASRLQGYHHTAPANAILFKEHKCFGRGCTCCQKTKLPLSLFCYFYVFIFNASIFHSYFFQMGRNAFPRSTVYSSWAPQAEAVWRKSFPIWFTCSFLGHGTVEKSIEK